MENQNIFFLDYEASSLSWDSYPIEVAWGSEFSNIESYLISPATMKTWKDWNPDSEKIHKISRQELISSGTDPTRVCDLIFEKLNNVVVYTDNPDWDSLWTKVLFNSCNKNLPSIDVRNIDSLLIEIVCPEPSDRINGLVEILTLKAFAREMVKGRHRAALDVEYLINLYKLAKSRTNA